MPITDGLLRYLANHTFDGSARDARAEDWLIRFERICMAFSKDITADEMYAAATLSLIKDASRWYENIKDSIKATATHSIYVVFKTKFRERFIQEHDANDAFDQLRNLNQGKRSATEYVNLFMKLHSRISDLNDTNACRLLRGGLRADLRRFVENHPAVNDFNSLVALVERLDHMPRSTPQTYHNNFQNQYRPRPQQQNSNRFTPPSESFPQPMELDSIQSKNRKPRDQQKKTDFENGLCFYCHAPGHTINGCPKRSKNGSGKAQRA